MNGKKATPPCPCGFQGHPGVVCKCAPGAVARYRSRISGPLLDRIDLHLHVPPLPEREMDGPPGEPSAAVRARVAAARERQLRRQRVPNAQLPPGELEQRARPTPEARALLRAASAQSYFSARAHQRVLKVALTLADLKGRDEVGEPEVAEALNLRGGEALPG